MTTLELLTSSATRQGAYRLDEWTEFGTQSTLICGNGIPLVSAFDDDLVVVPVRAAAAAYVCYSLLAEEP
jgi:hypothetical protein